MTSLQCVSVCVCVHVCVCMYEGVLKWCMYVHVYVQGANVCICLCLSKYVHVLVHTYIHISIIDRTWRAAVHGDHYVTSIFQGLG